MAPSRARGVAAASAHRTTHTQASATNKVAQNMQDILEITRQTTRGTQQAAGSIRDLAAVAQELKSSVAGFKL